MPTLMELAGATYPGEAKNVAANGPDGVSLVPTFRGKPLNRNKPVFYEYSSGAAIQDGSMKLVRTKTWELYDLSKDRTETKNIIDQHPELAKDLLAKWDRWFEECTGVDYETVVQAKEAAKAAKKERDSKQEQ